MTRPPSQNQTGERAEPSEQQREYCPCQHVPGSLHVPLVPWSSGLSVQAVADWIAAHPGAVVT
jgi:hypothetical protein